MGLPKPVVFLVVFFIVGSFSSFNSCQLIFVCVWGRVCVCVKQKR